jgi:C4-dicarboxylate transporter DctM subunit
MTPVAVAGLGFAAMLFFIAIRMPVGLAMLVTGSAGLIWFSGWNSFLYYMNSTPFYLFSNYTLSVIPLFILMGAIAERSGLSTRLFTAAAGLIGHWRGGLAMALIGACAAFGAICGSSVATTATFARATLPEFRRYRYAPHFATGAVAVGGTLGILIPPSIILVVYAITTEQNIAKLFKAALIPGLMAAVFYCVVIGIMARLKPELAPAHELERDRSRLADLRNVWPVILLAFVVVGGIYGGVFTPTEGAGVGAIAMVLIAEALLQTAETSAMIFIIILGSQVFEAFLGRSQLPEKAAEFVVGFGLPPLGVIVLLMAFYIVLGAVMDELAMILLTLPVFFPIVSALDFGLLPDETAIWFGILVLIVVGIGLTCPPIGLNVFVVSAIAREVPITAIYRGVLPFIAADIVRLSLVIAFPALALWLVRLLD